MFSKLLFVYFLRSSAVSNKIGIKIKLAPVLFCLFIHAKGKSGKKCETKKKSISGWYGILHYIYSITHNNKSNENSNILIECM